MKVKELIAALQKFDPEMRVAVNGELNNEGLAVEATVATELTYVDLDGEEKQQVWVGAPV